jgi:hypothetical protein
MIRTLAAIALAFTVASLAFAGGTTAAPASASCKVTLPNGRTPPGEKKSKLWHGDGKLFVVLWPNGIAFATKDQLEPGGAIDMKFPWWRVAHGQLKITGHRLDAKARPAGSIVPDGYGPWASSRAPSSSQPPAAGE